MSGADHSAGQAAATTSETAARKTAETAADPASSAAPDPAPGPAQGVASDAAAVLRAGQRTGAAAKPAAAASGQGLGFWLRVTPLALFAGLGGVFAYQLLTAGDDALPSAYIGRAAPDFDLPTLSAALKGASAASENGESADPAVRLTTADLATGEVLVVNFWASWCAPCRVEHPHLMSLAESGAAKVYGIAYRDRAPAAQSFLDELGDPFERTGLDETGRVGLSWGLAGVPETFILKPDGTVAYKHVGPILDGDLERLILPAIEAASQGGS